MKYTKGWVIHRGHSYFGVSFYRVDSRTWSRNKHPGISTIPNKSEIVNKGNLFKEYEERPTDYQTYGWIKTSLGVNK